MRRATLALACIAATAMALPAAARDERLKFPIEGALAKGQSYRDKVDPAIRLYFGDQAAPAGAKTIGEWTSNKKTNAANKSDQEACDIAFISAIVSLQDRARREGGNAVVKITSVYRNEPFQSATEYMCGAGHIIAGVALRGTVVKLEP
jgi:uncharacterized protein YbjQ (UPF0145 family)